MTRRKSDNDALNIVLDRFQPREYQKPIAAAIEAGYRNIIAVLPRRAWQGSRSIQLRYTPCFTETNGCLVHTS